MTVLFSLYRLGWPAAKTVAARLRKIPIDRMRVTRRFLDIRHNLHFVYSNRSFCSVNVVHIVFVTAFLKNFRDFINFVYLYKNADTFVNNHKCVGKVLTNQEMLSAILRSSSCDIFPIIVCEMPSFSHTSTYPVRPPLLLVPSVASAVPILMRS